MTDKARISGEVLLKVDSISLSLRRCARAFRCLL